MTRDQVLADPMFEALILRILKREGVKFHNVSGDPGGPTAAGGVTAIFLKDLYGRTFTVAELRRRTLVQVTADYALWISRFGFWRLAPAPRLLDAVADFGVHSGRVVAIKALQRSVGAGVDGRLGAKTAAAGLRDPELARDGVNGERLILMGKLLEKPHQVKFAEGWLNRMAGVLTWRPENEDESEA